MSRKAILIMVDSQRWDMVNCYKETGLSTPNLDRLASEGLRFDRAYTTQAVCQPARAAIFTGQYPHSVGSWTNSYGISDTAHSIGERLQLDGVHTAYIGKWHLDGGDYFGLGRCPKGWDDEYWYDMKRYLDELPEDFRPVTRDASSMDRMDFAPEQLYGRRCSDKAIDFLEKHADEDFFLVVSYDEPHGPFICPPPYSHMYDGYRFPQGKNVHDTLENKPAHQQVWADKFDTWDPEDGIQDPFFFGCNSFVDDEIGRVLRAIDEHAPDAMVIYTSDHGEMLHAHRLMSKGPNCYDEIARIPFIVRAPGVPAGQVDAHPVSHINIVPTILEYMGSKVPEVLEGVSILPELYDPSKRINPYIFMEFGRYEVDHDGFGGFQPLRAVFDGRYKLVINLLTSDELYDIESDPEEMVNLITDPAHEALRDHLHDVLLDHMNTTRDPFRGYYWERRPWRKNPRPADWDYTALTRQRIEDPRFEPRQLDYSTGLPIASAARVKEKISGQK